MTVIKSGVLPLSTLLLILGCASNSIRPQAPAPYPEWYYNPVIDQGLATAECVPIPGNNQSLAKKRVLENGRAAIAFQINTRVKAMDKTYVRMQGAASSSTFERAVKLVTRQHLSGVRARQFARLTDNGKEILCALITMDPEASRALLKDLIETAEVKLSSQDESVLAQQFLSHQTQDD